MDSPRSPVRESGDRLITTTTGLIAEAGDRRPASVVGRHARLALVFAYNKGRTALSHAYAEPPFRVGRCFPDGDGVHMILASSAPGVFGGDCLRQIVRVERGARVRLTSQSALQVHPTPDDAVARLQTEYHVDDDAQLRCHWDPVIPFSGARLDHRIELRVADQGSLYWSDALMTGRQASGERWRFLSVAHQLALWHGSSLEYLERYAIEPGERGVLRRWMTDDASYLGTTLASGPQIESAVAERLHAELGTIRGVHAASDLLNRRLLIVRLMCASGPAFHDARLRVNRALRS
jgi:urease accessory protein